MTDTDTSFEAVLREHKELRKRIADLKVFLQKPRPDLGESGCHAWATELAQNLVVLHRRLTEHFSHEEECGFLEGLESQHPRAVNAVKTLKREHGNILGEFRTLLDSTLMYADCKNPEIINLRRETLATLAHMKIHETKETRLIQDLASEDLGAGD